MAYWLVQAIPPFWLAIIATVLTYILAPIFTGPNAAKVKPVIDQKAQELKNSVTNIASSTANTAQDLGSRAVDTASSATSRAAETAQDLKDRTANTASYAADRASEMGQDVKNRTANTASYTADRAREASNTSAAHLSGNQGTTGIYAYSASQGSLAQDRRDQLHSLEEEGGFTKV